MTAGIVLLSLGLKKVLGYVVDTEEHTLSDALYGVPLVAPYGGVAMFLLANVAFKWRALRSFSPLRLGTVVLLVVAMPLAAGLPALVSLLVLAVVLVVLVVAETRHYAETRGRSRRTLHRVPSGVRRARPPTR